MIRRQLKLLKRMDWSILAATVLLLGIGVAFIYSAGQSQSAAYRQLYLKQLLWAGLGFVCFLWFACLDYNYWYRRAWWIYLLGLALLLLVFAPGVGAKISGARRWIQIAGVRLLQPAELAKLALIMALARLFGAPGRNPCRRRVVAVGLILTLAMFLLIAAQPDMGTALVLLPVLGAIMFAAGVPARMLWRLVGMGAAALAVVLALLLMPPVLGWDEARHDALLNASVSAPTRKTVLWCFYSVMPTHWTQAGTKLNHKLQSDPAACGVKDSAREPKTFWASCRAPWRRTTSSFRSSPKKQDSSAP